MFAIFSDFGIDIADVKGGDIVVVAGCGPVGQFVIASCKLRGVARIFAIDSIESRLNMAKAQGAEVINFNKEDPKAVIKDATKGAMANIVVDSVGIDAVCPSHGPAAKESAQHKNEFRQEVKEIAPKTNPKGKNWVPGDAPSQVLRSSVELTGKCGTISIIGVYAEKSNTFPIGNAMNKNLKIVMGNCHHRAYIPKLLHMVEAGLIDPTQILTQKEPITNVVEAYQQFDLREPGWVKVALKP